MNQRPDYSLSFFKTCSSRNYEAPHLGSIPIQDSYRVLLLQTPNHNVLFDAGPGGFYTELRTQHAVYKRESLSLLEAMDAHGLFPEDITDIVFSHLHYNTVGGILQNGSACIKKQGPVFKNAKVFVSRASYQRAETPHLIDKECFIPNICDVLENSADLTFISHGDVVTLDDVLIEFHESQGHSPGMMLSEIHYKNNCIIMGTDLLPRTQCTDLTVFNDFDRFTEKLVDEKKALLDRAIEKDAWIFYPNDVHYAYSKIIFDQNKYLPTDHTNRLPD